MDQETPFPTLSPRDGGRAGCLMAFTSLDSVPNGDGALGQRVASAPLSAKAGWTSKCPHPQQGQRVALSSPSSRWGIFLRPWRHLCTDSLTHSLMQPLLGTPFQPLGTQR